MLNRLSWLWSNAERCWQHKTLVNESWRISCRALSLYLDYVLKSYEKEETQLDASLFFFLWLVSFSAKRPNICSKSQLDWNILDHFLQKARSTRQAVFLDRCVDFIPPAEEGSLAISSAVQSTCAKWMTFDDKVVVCTVLNAGSIHSQTRRIVIARWRLGGDFVASNLFFATFIRDLHRAGMHGSVWPAY